MSYPVVSSVPLLNAVSTPGVGAAHFGRGAKRTFQAYGEVASGTGAARVDVEVSDAVSPTANDWLTFGTVNLSLSTTRDTGGFTSDARWRWVRGNLISVSGTTPSITLVMGV
jgi:hypothetical protein